MRDYNGIVFARLVTVHKMGGKQVEGSYARFGLHCGRSYGRMTTEDVTVGSWTAIVIPDCKG